MSQTVIQIENIGKQYRLGKVGTGSLAHDIQRWWAISRGKEDPYLKIGEVNNRTQKGESDLVWALQNISFEVQQGDVLGIVGKNGAGKSTLLKLLSRVTQPSTGSIRVKGRIASLLEVGTGFHPELSGRENIFLNGAILGMTKSEIRSKLDEIIAFSGVERYIDTPVKRYSSGMYVRLAFAVAAHLEPEILIVDEVLAVGDAEFQKKCLGKMKDVSGSGRTVLFVSHNMAAVKSLCHKAVLLKHGQMAGMGPASEIVSQYLGMDSNSSSIRMLEDPLVSEDVTITEIGVRAPSDQHDGIITEGKGAELYVRYSIANENAENYHFTFHLNDENGEPLFGFGSLRDQITLKNGEQTLVCRFPDYFFNVGNFYITMLVVKDKKKVVLMEKDIAMFSVVQRAREIGQWYGREPGSLIPSFKWHHE